MHLLIADDHAINLQLLRAQLLAEGHTVLEATNGVEALEVLEIRRSKKLNALPFILYTSTYNSAEDRKLAQSVGADRYVVKPSPPGVLFDALREAVQESRDATDRTVPRDDETHVLRQYNATLVRKLEERNIELQETLDKLQTANAEILELNRSLESRVQKRTAELQTANRDLESFSSSISHDLRAPLRAIGGFTGMLRRDHATRLASDAATLLERIEANVKQMTTLIDDLLEFARLGRQAITPQAVELAHVVRECLKELAHEQEGRIEKHGGRVWAESVPDQGATFYFSLPAAPPSA